MIKEKLFPAQEDDERIVMVLRKHWFNYIIFICLPILMIIPVIIMLIYAGNNLENLSELSINLLILGIPLYLLGIMGMLIFGFVDYYLDVYVVTDRRIVDICQKGLFNRAISELNLSQIQDIKAQVSGFYNTLFHFGDVLIQTAAEVPNFTFESIPHPYETSKRILDLHEAYVKRTNRKETTKFEDLVKRFQETIEEK